jgi:hypothetical protein
MKDPRDLRCLAVDDYLLIVAELNLWSELPSDEGYLRTGRTHPRPSRDSPPNCSRVQITLGERDDRRVTKRGRLTDASASAGRSASETAGGRPPAGATSGCSMTRLACRCRGRRSRLLVDEQIAHVLVAEARRIRQAGPSRAHTARLRLPKRQIDLAAVPECLAAGRFRRLARQGCSARVARHFLGERFEAFDEAAAF